MAMGVVCMITLQTGNEKMHKEKPMKPEAAVRRQKEKSQRTIVFRFER